MADTTTPGTGRITRIIGAVVDVEFPPDAIPAMYNALKVTVQATSAGEEPHEITLEVAQHLGDNIVRTISLKPTDGLVRGTQVRDTGAPISVPVGDVTKGHVFNVTGDVLNLGPGEQLEITERWPIHRQPPACDQLESKEQMFETGIKVIDLLTPYVQGGKIGLFGGAGVGKTVLIQETIPGDDTSMRILTTYSDQNGKVRFASFGQTLLEDMRPMGVGNPLAIVSRTDETIVTEAARLLEAVGYTGFANFDIKVDPRDGSHRFFEINTRLGRSNYYVTAAGDNAARWLMDDLVLGRPLPEGLTVARGESLYTVAPKAILLDYIRDDALRREVRGLYALGRDADPLDYPAEKSLRRRLYPLVFAFRQWKTCRAAMADKRAREKAAEDLEGAGDTADHRTKGTASGKDDEHVASASPELPLADGLAACAKAAS